MKIDQKTIFNFSFNPDGSAYNFSIEAASQAEACEKLYAALVRIAAEIKDSLHPSQAKSN